MFDEGAVLTPWAPICLLVSWSHSHTEARAAMHSTALQQCFLAPGGAQIHRCITQAELCRGQWDEVPIPGATSPLQDREGMHLKIS